MKISTRSRYGLRAMVEIADSCGIPAMLNHLAGTLDVSVKYLHHLLTRLKQSGLIKSVRGARGGFLLTRSPETIRVSEIITSLEGSISVIDCVDDPERCVRAGICTSRDVWRELNSVIESTLSRITLADLLKQTRSGEWSSNETENPLTL